MVNILSVEDFRSKQIRGKRILSIYTARKILDSSAQPMNHIPIFPHMKGGAYVPNDIISKR
jgi:hypothetical protein